LAYAWENGAVRLDKIYLECSHRGLGLGRRMLERVVEAAVRRNAREIRLRVNKNNAQALAAYRKFGFSVSGELVEDIGGGFAMDDYALRLPLDGAGSGAARPTSPPARH
jgi:ribosomal protein S18 acetylase RimI-like enzyme